MCCYLCSSQIRAISQRCMELLTPQRMLIGLLPPALALLQALPHQEVGRKTKDGCFKTHRRLCLGDAHTPLENTPSSVHHSLLPACSSFFPPCIPKGGSKGLLGWEPLRVGMLPLVMTIHYSLNWGQNPQKLRFLNLNSNFLHFCST